MMSRFLTTFTFSRSSAAVRGGAARRRAGCAAALCVLAWCAASFPLSAQSGSFIWVDKFEDVGEPPTAEYTIGVGDLLNVQVWEQEKMSAKMRVRSDGRISVPFINDIEAAGKTPVRLGNEIENGLKSVVLNPRVTVIVEESKPLTVSVLGEVLKPGSQTLEAGSGVAQVLATAGGLTQYAHKDRIYVVRSGPKPVRVRFTYEALTRALGRAPMFRLRGGDVVVVE
jgi:polysaccharide biosynthesis/export protein